MTRSPAADQAEVLALVGDLLSVGARRGAAQVLFNAAAQRQAAKVHDLSQRPAVRTVFKSAEHPNAANDHLPASSEAPASPVV